MSFLLPALPALAGGLLGGPIIKALTAKKAPPPVTQRAPTRDDAMATIERDRELSRRRGASADRISGASGEPVGGLGRLIASS